MSGGSDNVNVTKVAEVTDTINGNDTEIQFGTVTPVKRTVTEPVPTTVPKQFQAVQIPATNSAGLLPDKFEGNSFKMWQKKMFFYLTTLKLSQYTREERPILAANNTDRHAVATVHAWVHGDFLCKGYIQSRLSDQLYNVYCNFETSKALWDSLDKNYRTEDVGSQKYVV